LSFVQTLGTDPDVVVTAVANEPSWDRPGGLQILQRRSWATWQLAASGLVLLLIGMMIGYSGKRPQMNSTTAAGGGGGGLISLGASGAGSSATTALPRTSGAVEVVPTTAPDATTTPPTTTATASGPIVVLAARTTGTGPTDLAAFTAGGSWTIGWAFTCVGAPGGSATFAISVVSDAGGAAKPAVQQSSRQGQGVTPETSVGRQHLKITTDPACRWAVKVTGVAG
jgi:hypothetical protein